MARLSLEERVGELESRLTALQNELRAERRGRAKDWRRTIGAFTDDEGVKEILQEALRLREANRKKARSRRTTRRKTS
jgi:hypothetical protein